ncbi:hypothetical protein CRM22_008411, partial [Opisthorchis felineus]
FAIFFGSRYEFTAVGWLYLSEMNRTGKVVLFVIFFIGLVANSTQLGSKDRGHKEQSEDYGKHKPHGPQPPGHKGNNHHEVCDPTAAN